MHQSRTLKYIKNDKRVPWNYASQALSLIILSFSIMNFPGFLIALIPPVRFA